MLATPAITLTLGRVPVYKRKTTAVPDQDNMVPEFQTSDANHNSKTTAKTIRRL